MKKTKRCRGIGSQGSKIKIALAPESKGKCPAHGSVSGVGVAVEEPVPDLSSAGADKITYDGIPFQFVFCK